MNMDLLAAFDFANLVSMVQENILPIILGTIPVVPVNKPGTPYQPLIKAIVSLITGRKTVEVPATTVTPATPTPSLLSNLLPLLLPLIQQLAVKPPVATIVTPPDPTMLPSDPNSLIAWIKTLLNSPEQPTVTQPVTPHIENPNVSPVEVRWEHFTGCFQAMVDLYPDFDISAVSNNGNTEVKKVKRAQPK